MNTGPKMVTLVTGAARGLGRAYCEKLSSLGSAIIANDIDAVAVADLVAELRDRGHPALAVAGSVTDPELADRAVAAALETFGRLDAVIANAGFLRDRSFAKSTAAEFSEVIDVHLNGSANVARAAWPALRDSGSGRLVLTSSSAGLYGSFGQANYSAAKLGVVGLMNTLKIEGAKYHICTNVIAPLAHTRLSKGVFPEAMLQEMSPEWTAGIVAHLVSPDCTTNGMILEIGAGKVRRVTIEPSPIVQMARSEMGDIGSTRAAVDQLEKMPSRQPWDGAEGVSEMLE